MNILVTGANGQLGNEMRIVSRNTSDNYIFTDVNQVEGLETTYLDITDLDAIRKLLCLHSESYRQLVSGNQSREVSHLWWRRTSPFRSLLSHHVENPRHHKCDGRKISPAKDKKSL